MLKRTLFFTQPYHLSIRYDQLLITKKETGEIKQVPVEDIGYIVLDDAQITITQSVAQLCAAHNVAVIFCNERHLPVSMMLNLDVNYLQSEIFGAQIASSEPLKKSLWKQTVEIKIRNQAALLKKLGKEFGELLVYANNVKSGDSSNMEGVAARVYWNRLFGNDFEIETYGADNTEKNENFKRERFGKFPNPALNYGYAILRAAIAKGLTGSGLLPTLGIHHHNRYNAYCLADDIMEPYRPFVDETVINLIQVMTKNPELFPTPKTKDIDVDETEDNKNILTKEMKAELLKTLTVDTFFDDATRPLMVGVNITTASLAKCYTGETRRIIYPELR